MRRLAHYDYWGDNVRKSIDDEFSMAKQRVEQQKERFQVLWRATKDSLDHDIERIGGKFMEVKERDFDRMSRRFIRGDRGLPVLAAAR